MSQEKSNKHEREAPHSHLIQGLSPIIFIIIMVLDTIFNWSTQLSGFVPLFIKIALLIVFLGLAILLIQLSHKTLFHENEPSDKLITDGILKRVRNPMYLGIFFIYIAFICFTISLISIAVFIIVFILYNRLVNHEEAILEQLFGEDYKEYKKKVPKWIPKIF